MPSLSFLKLTPPSRINPPALIILSAAHSPKELPHLPPLSHLLLTSLKDYPTCQHYPLYCYLPLRITPPALIILSAAHSPQGISHLPPLSSLAP